MKNIFTHITSKIPPWLRLKDRNERMERGQVLIIVTLSVIGLVAVVGLVVDVGLLYLNHGKLRRSVDAAALAASSQFREGYNIADLTKAADEFLVLNGVTDPTATVETCGTNPGDPVLCTTPNRKLVRVRASSVIDLAFLPVIGIHQTTINAVAISEAASMDVVFVIDASDSMTYDAPIGDPMRDPAQCNAVDNCHPFEDVKDAAKAFVEQLFLQTPTNPVGYDRVAVVTFDDGARVDLSFSEVKATIDAAIDNLDVVEPIICDSASGPCRVYERYADCLLGLPWANGNCNGDVNDEAIIDEVAPFGFGDNYLGFDCPLYHTSGNPESCGTTSIGRGLLFAGDEFANPATFRQESLWVVILLTDGAANGPSYTCPNNTWTAPFCRDLSAISRHCFDAGDTSCLAKGGTYADVSPVDGNGDNYDADDYARDMVDFVSEDQQALIFTIGLGSLVQTSEPLDAFGVGAGEQLLEYAADIGGGTYYYAPGAAQLRDIFLDIASNLATRLTQ